MIVDRIELQFDWDELEAAHIEWGCNCGPATLAAILNLPLDRVQPAVVAAGFATKRYMSPTMMATALRHLGVKWTERKIDPFDLGGLAFPNRGLARIQWEGPWTAAGANLRWAYRHTHWVASWKATGAQTAADAVMAVLSPVLFDINGGLMELDEWEETVVPAIVATIPRADGDWHVTHCWEVEG